MYSRHVVNAANPYMVNPPPGGPPMGGSFGGSSGEMYGGGSGGGNMGGGSGMPPPSSSFSGSGSGYQGGPYGYGYGYVPHGYSSSYGSSSVVFFLTFLLFSSWLIFLETLAHVIFIRSNPYFYHFYSYF